MRAIVALAGSVLILPMAVTASAASAASSLAIAPPAQVCFIVGRPAVIATSITPAGRVRTARVHFKLGTADAFDSVRMKREGNRFVGVLPAPGPGVRSLSYYVQAMAGGETPSASSVTEGRVVTSDAQCAGELLAASAPSGLGRLARSGGAIVVMNAVATGAALVLLRENDDRPASPSR